MSNAAQTDWNTLGKSAVNEVLEWAKGAKEFVADQAPELVREVLAWGFWSNLILSIMLFLFAFIAVVVALKASKGCLNKETPVCFIIALVTSIGSILLFINGIIFAYEALYVHIAPLMYLIEYLKDLTK